MAADGASSLLFHPQAPPALQADAVRLLLRRRSVEARTVLASLASVESLQAHPADSLAVLVRGQQVVAAMLDRIQPGKAALLWSPRVAEGEPAEAAPALVRAVLGELQKSQVRIVQAFPDAEAVGDEQQLLAAGFQHISDLLYLVWLSEPSIVEEDPDSSGDRPGDLQFVEYDSATHDRLARIVELTYQGTRDCPQLNGVREIDDVLASYRATGAFDPTRWLIAQHGGEDVGCLLLAAHPGAHQWELVYLGVVPSARQTGLGRQLVLHAQGLCSRAGARQLVLAVDAENSPALKLYASAGFVAWDRRAVYLQIFADGRTSDGIPQVLDA